MMIKFLDLQKINLLYQTEIRERMFVTFHSVKYLQGNELN